MVDPKAWVAARGPSNKGQQDFDATALTSKSQLKREAQSIKALARELIGLSNAQLARMALEPDTLAAVRAARAITSNGARKRQMQFVAKLLRRSDAEEIERTVEGFRSDTRQAAGTQHRSEQWRDRLVLEGDPALSELVQQRPGLDVQAMRQWIRTARREQSSGRPPAAARSLFRALRELDRVTELPPARRSIVAKN